MGRLPWREKWSVLGCRRGWVRLVPFVAFVLVGYFGLYARLRASKEIELVCWRICPTGEHTKGKRYYAVVQDDPASPFGRSMFYVPENWPRRWEMRAMWPAVRLEVAVDGLGWLPWSGIREDPTPYMVSGPIEYGIYGCGVHKLPESEITP